MNLMSRLSADGRHRRRLREARAEIRRVERAVRMRQRAPEPGYDELRDPLFLATMAIAIFVLIFDLHDRTSVLVDWVQLALAAVRSWA